MRCPSSARILAAFRDLDLAKARLIRRLAKQVDDADKLERTIEKRCPKTADYARRCFGNPYDSHMWRVTMAMHAIDELLGTYGVEGLGRSASLTGPPAYEYCNTGDPYNTTLIYSHRTDTLRIGSWGDIAERENI